MTAFALFAAITATLIPAIQTDLHRAVRRQRTRQIRAAIERLRQRGHITLPTRPDATWGNK